MKSITRSSQEEAAAEDDDDAGEEIADDDELEDELIVDAQQFETEHLDRQSWPPEVLMIYDLIQPATDPDQVEGPSSQSATLPAPYDDLPAVVMPLYTSPHRLYKGAGLPDNYPENEAAWRELATADDIDFIKNELPRITKRSIDGSEISDGEVDFIREQSAKLAISISRILLVNYLKEDMLQVNQELGRNLWAGEWTHLQKLMSDTRIKIDYNKHHLPTLADRARMFEGHGLHLPLYGTTGSHLDRHTVDEYMKLPKAGSAFKALLAFGVHAVIEARKRGVGTEGNGVFDLSQLRLPAVTAVLGQKLVEDGIWRVGHQSEHALTCRPKL